MGSIFAVRTTFGITPPLYSENLQRVPTLKPGELVESIFAAEQPSQISTLQVLFSPPLLQVLRYHAALVQRKTDSNEKARRLVQEIQSHELTG